MAGESIADRVGLGLDGGGSSSRWLLLSGSKVLAEGRTGPLTGHLYSGPEQRGQLGRLQRVLEKVGNVHAPGAVVAGVAGLHPGTPAYDSFAKVITDTLKLKPQRVLLGDDMRIAYASAFEPGAGVLVYAGTGSFAYHETASGAVVRAGGYGYLIDDAGSGYWIGHEGLKGLFRQIDAAGRPSDTPLVEALYSRLGSCNWPEIMPLVYGGGRSFVASLAPAVAEAEQAGDRVARAILERAGTELARLARDVLARLERPLPVAFAGGVTRLSPVVRASLEHHLGAPVRLVEDEPVYAAAQLALRLAG